MRVKRIICPVCEVEERVVSDEKNLNEYSEEIVSQACPEHKDNPEIKLLDAIFGKGGE